MAQCLVPPSPRQGDGPYMHMNVYKIIIDYTGMCVSICLYAHNMSYIYIQNIYIYSTFAYTYTHAFTYYTFTYYTFTYII